MENGLQQSEALKKNKGDSVSLVLDTAALFCTSGVSCGLAEDKDVIFVTRYTFNPFPVTPSK